MKHERGRAESGFGLLEAKARSSQLTNSACSVPRLCHNKQTARLWAHGAKMAARKKNASKHQAEEVFIPDKLYFRIGEVATLCHLPAYVLRFWETEFPQLKPVKSSTGQRMYRKRDVEGVLRIKQLLYEQGFTISGARQQLRTESKGDKTQAAIPFPSHSASELQHIRQGLREILNLLSTRRTG
jgi:DNA-binding transcriptional MerR regulator